MKRGFTLIELLVSIAIIGILATVVTVSTSSARIKARDSKREADLSAVSAAMELYYAQKREYPIVTSWAWGDTNLTLKTALDPYLSTWPVDPKNGQGFGLGYVYYSNNDGSKYVLDATLEAKNDTPTVPSVTNGDIGSLPFYFSGTYKQVSGGNFDLHYRLTNR